MAVPTESAFRPESVGQRFPPDTIEVTPELITNYAHAVNDYNPRYYNEKNSPALIAPPMFGIVPAMRVLRTAMESGLLPISQSRTLHLEQEMHFITPILPGDQLRSHGKVQRVDQHSTGSTIDIVVTTRSTTNAIRVLQKITLFEWEAKKTTALKNSSIFRQPKYVENVYITDDQPFRYARASFTEGIRPHEDHKFAQSLGYRTYFLQGQCTMAFAAKAIVDGLAGRNPERLQKLKTHFAQVVYPRETLTTRIWEEQVPGKYAFETTKKDGTLALTQGTALISI